MLKIINLNCPEKTILNKKLSKLISQINPNEKFIITFIMNYDLKQLQSIESCLDKPENTSIKKYKIIEFNIIDNDINNKCDGRERLALVLSNIRSLRSSINLIKTTTNLKEVYNIYQTKTNKKIKREKW